LTELRLSHIAVDIDDLSTQQLPSVEILHLSQITKWTLIISQQSIIIITSDEPELWQILLGIFPSLDRLNIRVNRNSVLQIEQLVKEYSPQVRKCRVCSVGDKISEYFGRHAENYYSDFPPKSYRTFDSYAEIEFDFIKDL